MSRRFRWRMSYFCYSAQRRLHPVTSTQGATAVRGSLATQSPSKRIDGPRCRNDFNVGNHTNDELSAARPTEYATTPGRAATARPRRREPTVPPVSPRTSHQRRRPRGRWGTPHRTGTGQCAPPGTSIRTRCRTRRRGWRCRRRRSSRSRRRCTRRANR